MVAWVVKSVVYGYRDYADVHGVYTNLALAARAAMQVLHQAMMDNHLFYTFECEKVSWGYNFSIEIYEGGSKWPNDYGRFEIIRVPVNE